MSAGQIVVEFAFERDPQAYYGPRDAVRGHVKLSYWHPASVREFFGPLRLEVTLQGTLQTHIDRAKPILTRKVTLFRNVHVLHNGTLRLQLRATKEFPFAVTFPEYVDDTADPGESSSTDERPLNQRYPLPPTFSRGSQAAWKKATGVAIVYEMSAQLLMAGIDVQIQYPATCPTLTYELALPDPDVLNTTCRFKNTWSLTTRDLLLAADRRRSERRRSFKETLKGLVTEEPKSILIAQCIGMPRHIFAGQHLAFDVRVRLSDEIADIPSQPEIWLDSCTVTIRALTRLSRTDHPASKFGWIEDHREIGEDVAVLPANIQPDGPFTREDHFTKAITTEPLGTMSSSFDLGRISHEHRVLIRMRLRAGSQELGFNAESVVNVYAAPLLHPPPDDEREELPSYQSVEDA